MEVAAASEIAATIIDGFCEQKKVFLSLSLSLSLSLTLPLNPTRVFCFCFCFKVLKFQHKTQVGFIVQKEIKKFLKKQEWRGGFVEDSSAFSEEEEESVCVCDIFLGFERERERE